MLFDTAHATTSHVHWFPELSVFFQPRSQVPFSSLEERTLEMRFASESLLSDDFIMQ